MELLRQSAHQGTPGCQRDQKLRAVDGLAIRGCLRPVCSRCVAARRCLKPFRRSSMLAKAGERMPLACVYLAPFIFLCDMLTVPLDRYKKMVYAFLANHCGPQFVESLPPTSYHARFPSPPDGFYPTGSAQVNNVNIYSPGTYAAVDPAISPMGQQMQDAAHSHMYHPRQV